MSWSIEVQEWYDKACSYHEPKPKLRFWWSGHKNPQHLISMIVAGILRNDDILLQWNLDMGSVSSEDQRRGKVTWTRDEWDKAWNNAECLEYLDPVTVADLGPNEELCGHCSGTRFEIERDFDVIGCGWCNFTGKQVKRPESKPTTGRRSPMHPELPTNQNPSL